MYAIVNITLQTTDFFNTFADCSAACVMYPAQTDHVVYVIDFANGAVEQL